VTEYSYDTHRFAPAAAVPPSRAEALRGGDHPRTSPYLYDPDIVLAVNVALAAERPLLVAGPPGCGKSALAASIAREKDWTYLETVVTARTEARDLQWRFDTVRRLRDATAGRDLIPERYLERGVLWRAYEEAAQGRPAVVLIDEIDKADPDLPNGLLEVLGTGGFAVPELGLKVTAPADGPRPFVVVTTNRERDLAQPFVRRCVVLALHPPSADRLVSVAAAWGLATDGDHALARSLAEEVERLNAEADEADEPFASIAEYLDALRTCLKLGITLASPEWQAVRRATLRKRLDEPWAGR
jgi:MoxR-like ATPase